MNRQPAVYILANKREDVKRLEASLETTIDRKKQSELAGFVWNNYLTGFRHLPRTSILCELPCAHVTRVT